MRFSGLPRLRLRVRRLPLPSRSHVRDMGGKTLRSAHTVLLIADSPASCTASRLTTPASRTEARVPWLAASRHCRILLVLHSKVAAAEDVVFTMPPMNPGRKVSQGWLLLSWGGGGNARSAAGTAVRSAPSCRASPHLRCWMKLSHFVCARFTASWRGLSSSPNSRAPCPPLALLRMCSSSFSTRALELGIL
eukprot:scaffold16568_cov119-Isochrysis_galbana.AAC.2